MSQVYLKQRIDRCFATSLALFYYLGNSPHFAEGKPPRNSQVLWWHNSSQRRGSLR